MTSLVKGRQMKADLPVPQSNRDAYSQNVYRHLQGRARLTITAESAARAIGVLEGANRSAARGSQPVKPAFK